MLDLPAMLRRLDAHHVDRVVLIPAMNDPLPETPAALLTIVRRLLRSPCHVVGRVINEAVMTDEGDLRLGGKVHAIYPRPDNASVAAAIAAHPQRFLGWIFLNPRAAVGLDELERWRHVPGFVGVKLHPHWHGWPIADAIPIGRRCEELGLPVLIHLGFGERGRWRVLADACPRLRIVFAHAAIPHFDRIWGDIRDDRRLWLDVSSPYLDEALARDAVRAVGPERVLYGTDAPYGFHDDAADAAESGPRASGLGLRVGDDPSGAQDCGYDYGAIRGWVERLPVRAEAIDRVLGGNVERLLAREP